MQPIRPVASEGMPGGGSTGEPAPARTRPRTVPAWARRGWVRIAVTAVVFAVAFSVAQRISGKPSVDRQKDVGALIDNRVGAAVKQLQSAPPPGVVVYDAIRGPVVVIEAS